MPDEIDLDARLKIGDVLISSHGTRWTVYGWTPRGKLAARSPQGTEQSWWWTWRKDLPRRYRLERGGVEIL